MSAPVQKLLRLTLLGAVLIATPALAAQHPSLLFDASEIPAIRARLDGPLRQVREALEAGVHYPFIGNFPITPDRNYEFFNDRRAIPDSLLSFAFGAIILDPSSSIGGEAKLLAKNYLNGICNYPDWLFPETQDGPDPDLNSGHFLFGVALAYDWLYDELTPDQRQRCRSRVEVEGRKVYEAMLRNVWWMPEHLQNHNWINTSSLGMAALAFEGELSFSTGPWLDAVKENLAKVQYVLDLIEGGGWHEGTGYLHYGLDSLIPFSHALSRLKGGPDYADTRIVRDYPNLRRHMMPTSREHRREYVLWGDFSGFDNDNTLLPLFYAARKYRDEQSMWYAQRFIDGSTAGRTGFSSWPPGQRGMLLSAIFYDETVPATPPSDKGAAWDLDYYSKDLSLWASRSGWADGGGMLALKAGVFGGRGNWDRMRVNGWPGGYINFGHDHGDDMGVYFFADGEWLTSRVPGYYIGRNNGAPQANRTEFANSLLVDGQGQLGDGIRDCWMSSCTWFWDRISSINLRGSTANFSFALAAGSQLYPRSLGLEAFGRSVLFVDREIPVVRDVVRANSPRQFEILYHAMDGASRDGDWLKLDAKNGRALGVKVVSPASFEVSMVGKNAVHLDKFDPDGWMTSARIRPAARTTNAVFLTALVPQRSATWAGGRPTIEALDPADPGRGLSIAGLADGERIEVIFNEDPSHTGTAANLSVHGMAGVRKTRGDEVVRVMLASGTSLDLGSTRWIEVLEGGPASVEANFSEGRLDVSGDPQPLRIFAPGARVVSWNGVEVPFDREDDHVTIPAADGSAGGAGGSGGSGGDGGSGGSPGTGGCNQGGSGGVGGAGGVSGDGSGGAPDGGSGGAPGGGSGGVPDGGSGGIPDGGSGGGGGGSDDHCDDGEGGSAGGSTGGASGSGSKPGKKKGFLGCSTAADANQASPYGLALLALGSVAWRSSRSRRDAT